MIDFSFAMPRLLFTLFFSNVLFILSFSAQATIVSSERINAIEANDESD